MLFIIEIFLFSKILKNNNEIKPTKDIEERSEIELGSFSTIISEPIKPEPINDNIWIKIKRSLKNNNVIDQLIIILIIFAVILGIGIGFALRNANLSDSDKVYFGFLGELWIRSLKFISIPLIFFNIITGISDLYIEKDVKLIVFHMFLFYISSLLISLAIGYLLVLTIQPGK